MAALPFTATKRVFFNFARQNVLLIPTPGNIPVTVYGLEHHVELLMFTFVLCQRTSPSWSSVHKTASTFFSKRFPNATALPPHSLQASQPVTHPLIPSLFVLLSPAVEPIRSAFSGLSAVPSKAFKGFAAATVAATQLIPTVPTILARNLAYVQSATVPHIHILILPDVSFTPIVSLVLIIPSASSFMPPVIPLLVISVLMQIFLAPNFACHSSPKTGAIKQQSSLS